MSVIPAKLNFTIVKETTFRHEVILHEGDETTPVVDLTGCTATVPVRDRVGGTSFYSVPTTIDGLAGKITLEITAEDSAAFTWKRGFYTLYINFPGGDTNAYLHGALVVTET